MITLRLARFIANNLDGNWHYSDGRRADNSEAFLDGPDGERIKLSLGNASYRPSDHGRLFLTGEFDDLASHIPHNIPST